MVCTGPPENGGEKPLAGEEKDICLAMDLRDIPTYPDLPVKVRKTLDRAHGLGPMSQPPLRAT